MCVYFYMFLAFQSAHAEPKQTNLQFACTMTWNSNVMYSYLIGNELGVKTFFNLIKPMACSWNPFLGSSLVFIHGICLALRRFKLRGFISHKKELVKTAVEQVSAYPILSATLWFSWRIGMYQSLLAATDMPFKKP